MKIENIYNDLPVLETSRTTLRKIEKNDIQAEKIIGTCSMHSIKGKFEDLKTL